MNQFKNSKFVVALVLLASLLASCSTVKPVIMPATIQEDTGKERLIQADKMVVLALQYHDQAGFEKCSDLFVDAAEIYRIGDSIDGSRKALLAAAKCHLKAGKTDGFLLTMARYRTFLPPLQMPSEDERFLIDLADSMNRKPLTYPPLPKWGTILR